MSGFLPGTLPSEGHKINTFTQLYLSRAEVLSPAYWLYTNAESLHQRFHENTLDTMHVNWATSDNTNCDTGPNNRNCGTRSDNRIMALGLTTETVALGLTTESVALGLKTETVALSLKTEIHT